MSTVWVRTLWLVLAIVVGVFAPLSIGFGVAWGLAGAIACLTAALVWHLAHLAQLLGWLEGPLGNPLPRGRGAWGVAFAGLHRRARIRTGQQQALAERLERFVNLPGAARRRHRLRPQSPYQLDQRTRRSAFALSAQSDRGRGADQP